MPMLPDLNYRHVVIHDNFEALYRFARKNGMERTAAAALLGFNGRFTVFQWRNVALIGTGMGSAQTNCLVESLSERGCQAIVKIGTCSALHSALCEGDIIVPTGALVDEGATSWVNVKRRHDSGGFEDKAKVREYIEAKELATASPTSRQELFAEGCKLGLPIKREFDNPTVWSVDSYGCFDGSAGLYSKVDNVTYSVGVFGSPGTRSPAMLLGVEMECSALFARSLSLNPPIDSAALIVVSRTLKRLCGQDFAKREIETIESNETACIGLAIDVLNG